MAEWLPEDHLAWFVLDVVVELDLADSSLRTVLMAGVVPLVTRR